MSNQLKDQLSLGQVTEYIRWNEQGLVPAVIQDADSRAVLMLAYMNQESLKKSLTTGVNDFFNDS